MESMDTGVSQGIDTSSTSSTPAESTGSTQSSSEKLFRQSEVNEIVKKVKHGAVEDFKRMSAERPDYTQQKYGEPYTSSQPTSRSETYLSPDDVRRLAAEESQRLRDEWLADAQRKTQEQGAQKIVNEFFTKLSTGKEKYQDYDNVVGNVDYGRFPNVVQLLNGFIDNTADVMYELGKDRTKLAVLEQLATLSPNDAIIQAQRLSQSIKDNESVGKVRMPNEPLSQIKPSITGADNGGKGIRDLRAKYKA